MSRLVSAKVIDYMVKNPNVDIHVKDIVAATGLSLKQIKHSITNMRYNKEEMQARIEIVHAGSLFRYHPGATANSGKRIFQEVTVTNKGSVIVEDENGDHLYILKELDV